MAYFLGKMAYFLGKMAYFLGKALRGNTCISMSCDPPKMLLNTSQYFSRVLRRRQLRPKGLRLLLSSSTKRAGH